MCSAIKALWHRWAWKKTDCDHSLLILSRSSRPLIEMSAFIAVVFSFMAAAATCRIMFSLRISLLKLPHQLYYSFHLRFACRDRPVEMRGKVTGSRQHELPHRPICPFASSLWVMVSKINQTDCGTLTWTDTIASLCYHQGKWGGPTVWQHLSS